MRLKLLAKAKAIALKLRSYVPQSLPQTDAEFSALVKAVCSLGGWPVNDSFTQSIATMMQRLPDTATHRSAHSFVVQLRRAIVGQVAYNAIQDIRERQKREQAIKDVTTEVV